MAQEHGKSLALAALAGQQIDAIPVGLFTWGFDYYWKVAGLDPWQLACGSADIWHQAYIGTLEYHEPDLLWYSGSGGPEEPVLTGQDDRKWYIRDGNSGREYVLTKDSYALIESTTGTKGCDPVGTIHTQDDAKRLIPEFHGWGQEYLEGLSRLIKETGDRTLVLPHHSPAYICGCYAFGFERAMEAMMCEPDLFTYVCDRYASGDDLRMKQLAQAGAEAVFVADGWASCDIISPEYIRRFALPYQESIIQAAHRNGLKIIVWNEGDILPILADEAALSMDGFAFEQPRKNVNIQVSDVRSVFGDDRCLFGNVDSELMLLRNDESEIRSHVYEVIRQSGRGNPFILSTGSPLTNDVPPDAVSTMISAARTFGETGNS